MEGSLCVIGTWHDVVIPSDLAQVQRVADDIKRALVFYQFARRDVFCIVLALQEALVNAIKHGNHMDRHKNVSIRYRINSARFDVRIVDEGRGFKPEEVPDPTAEENLERPSGRGLLLMRHCMTEVVFHSPGNRLSMSRVRNP